MSAAIFCNCPDNCIHKSDCAVHAEPAEEAGNCTCLTPAEQRALPGAHYSDGRRYSRISKAWIFAEHWNDAEEIALLREKLAELRDLTPPLTASIAIVKERDAYASLLRDIDEYLSGNQQNNIWCGSRFHQDIKRVLSKVKP